MAYSPVTIANYFITTYASELAPFSIEKVVGLTYFSYGWYLAFSDCQSALIKEPLICKRTHATFGSLYESMIESGVNFYYKKLPNSKWYEIISKEDKRFLDRIWNTYGHLQNPGNIAFYDNGDTPWRKAILNCRLIIPMRDVYQYFKTKLVSTETKSA